MKHLNDILGAQPDVFSRMIHRLESASGEHGHDIRLQQEVQAKAREATVSLGLSPDGGSQRELFRALMVRVSHDNRRLASSIGGRDPDNAFDMTPRILSAVAALNTPKHSWLLIEEAQRRLLAAAPPLRLMKHVDAATVEELYGRLPLEEIMAVVRLSESKAWLHAYNKQLEQLKPGDFTDRDIVCLALDAKRYDWLSMSDWRAVTHNKEFGVIAVTPRREVVKGYTIITLALLLHYLNEIRLYSAHLRLRQDDSRFGVVVYDTIARDMEQRLTIAGAELHWRVVQRYVGQATETDTTMHLPHLQAKDVEWRQAEHLLMAIDPAVAFWDGLEYVGTVQDGVTVSFNVVDAVLNYVHERSSDKALSYHLRDSLWNELFARYMDEQTLRRQVLLQIGAG